jgi:hypothetical protein
MTSNILENKPMMRFLSKLFFVNSSAISDLRASIFFYYIKEKIILFIDPHDVVRRTHPVEWDRTTL